MIAGDAALARRLESFQAEFQAEFARFVDGGEILRAAGGVAVFAGPDSLLTQAFGVGLGEPATEADLDAIEELYRSRGAPSSIHVTPWTDPELLRLMHARGYFIHEFENVFVRELSDVGAPPPGAPRVELIADDQRDLWTGIAAESFANEDMSAAYLADIMRPFVLMPSARCYLATVDGEPAGTGASVIVPGSGIVGLFGAGTLPRFRNRGVQTALVQRRLADGVADGCSHALVTTVPGSASNRNVIRRGFQLAYTKLNLRRVFTSPASNDARP